MADEQTPLIQVVRVGPQRQRYSHSTLRRFCTIALGTTLIVVVILFIAPLRWLPQPHRHRPWDPQPDRPPSWRPPPHHHPDKGSWLSYDELVAIVKETPNTDNLRKWSQYYTSGPHLTGKNRSQAVWTQEKWREFGVASEIATYETFVSYPRDHRIALLQGSADGEAGDVRKLTHGQEGKDYNVKYECSLEEDVLEEDPTTGLDDRIPTFHGYSASGNITAQFVYANYGTKEDYVALTKAGVDLKDKIAITKYGKNMRGMKLKFAQELGMAGVIIYSDPGDDWGITEENGYLAYPDGPARNPSSVQRGSVDFLSDLSGDPTTPGYPSLPGAPRVDPQWAIPYIPSHPISFRDALPLLRALNGHGPEVSDLQWEKGGLAYKNVTYNIGPSPAGTVINLYNKMENAIAPCYDVIGVINGTIADEVVIIGNHRDAWIAGGAADPNSGTAVIDEVVRSFGVALAQGWKPRRTLVFASWDGEEQALIGSTEWVEQYLPWLSVSALAYLNVDVAASGPKLRLGASPLISGALRDAAEAVSSPNGTVPDRSARDDSDGRIKALGSGSDFSPFLDFAGIPVTDMGFTPGKADPVVYHYHSNYDSFHWMEKYGDPGFKRHRAIAQIWGLFAAHMVEAPIVPFNVTNYAVALGEYLQYVKELATNVSSTNQVGFPTKFPHLSNAITNLQRRAESFDADATSLNLQALAEVSHDRHLAARLDDTNRKYKLFERQFLHSEGLDGRSLFKHVVFAPG